MFEHSVPVPRLYKFAAKITEAVSKSEDSVKNLVYKAKHPNTKALYALIVETLKYNKQLDFLLKRAKLFEKEPRFNPWLAKVLVTELLWGKKQLPGQSKPIKTILAYQQILSAHAYDVHENEAAVNKVTRPRFVRINTILISIDDAINGFRDEGWTLVRHMDSKDYSGFLDKICNLTKDQFMIDIHIPELLIFPPNTEFYAHNAYKTGYIVLQDKASCLPAHLLSPEPGSIVLDMCAAPGMKTSHLAAKLNNNGEVYAVDLDARRLKTLEELMQKTGVTCVKVINKDILKVTDNDCKDVEYILVDPSCSGSGIVDRLDLMEPTVKDNKRVEKLRGFQIMILKHALRRFPKAKRIIYSTCSLYPEENEEVIQEVLTQTMYYKLVNAANSLKGPWLNFGSEKYGDIGKFCLYSKPDKEMSNGFFVAVFERLEDGEENQYFVPNPRYQNVETNKKMTKDRNEEVRIEKNDENREGKNEAFDKQLSSFKPNIRNTAGNNIDSKRQKKEQCKKENLIINDDAQHSNLQDANDLQCHVKDSYVEDMPNEKEVQNNYLYDLTKVEADIEIREKKRKKKHRHIEKYEEVNTQEQVPQYENHELGMNYIKAKKKKKHKRNHDNYERDEENYETREAEINEVPPKKKKAKKENEVTKNLKEVQSLKEDEVKKKRKHKHNSDNETHENINLENQEGEKSCVSAEINNWNLGPKKTIDQEKQNNEISNEGSSKKKKKKKKEKADVNELEKTEPADDLPLNTKKKHKKKRSNENEVADMNFHVNTATPVRIESWRVHKRETPKEDPTICIMLLQNYLEDGHVGDNGKPTFFPSGGGKVSPPYPGKRNQ
ncbi:hypothetical protein Trydic_g17656 [Trypoxylus dichotomus]